MEQLGFETCRFCRSPYSVEDEHHCAGIDRARSESWSRIYRYISKLAEWFEIDAAPHSRLRQLAVAKVIRDSSWRRVWTVQIRCRKCGAPYFVCEPPGYGDDGIVEHGDSCFKRMALVKAPRGRRKPPERVLDMFEWTKTKVAAHHVPAHHHKPNPLPATSITRK